MICDPHHHLWEARLLPGAPDVPDYTVDDLRRDLATVGTVERTVFVECTAAYRTDGPEAMRPVGETEWVAGIAREHGIIAGIVGRADLALGDAVDEVLAAHEDAGAGLFRGVRHATAWDASPDVRNAHTNAGEGLMRHSSFQRGIARLGARGLSFDAWLYHRQIPELTDLARVQPDVVMILDHLGAPLGVGPYAGRRDEVLAEWEAALVDLATCENVNVKVGGIGMPIMGFDWHRREGGATAEELADAWGPSLRRVIELFGVERCMFESNFPVDGRGATYRALWDTFELVSADLSEQERRALFHDTAARVYRLG